MGILERQQKREIDGVTYIVNPLPFGIGKRALLRFSKIASPVVSSKSLPDAIGNLIANLTDDDLDYFAKTFGDACWYVDGDKQVPLIPVNQADHFEGRYESFFSWLAFNVEVNFVPFFVAMTKKGAAALAASSKAAASTSGEKTG